MYKKATLVGALLSSAVLATSLLRLELRSCMRSLVSHATTSHLWLCRPLILPADMAIAYSIYRRAQNESSATTGVPMVG